MFFALQRVQKICNDLKDLVCTDKVSISNYKIIEGNYLGIDAVNKSDKTWNDFKTGDLWGGRDKHFWFRTSVTVPENFAGKTVALNFYTFEEGWDAINPQFILYVNGELIQAIDINHREIILTHNAEAGKVYNIDLHAYSGMLHDRKATLNGALVTLDEDTRALFYNLQVPVWVCEKLDEDDKRRIDMLNVLNDAINLIDMRKPHSDNYNASVKEANKFMDEEFYGKLCGNVDVTATCVGHTHIDVAWQWTVAQTREKAARSFSTVLNLMKQYPEYIFMSSQPQLYEFVKEDHPEIYAKIKEKVKEGKWEPEGAMWLEADCNVTSGESLVRQIMFGKKFFKDEFGVENEVLWLPDVFGYSAALPQILKKSDVNYFMTTKIAWNEFNKMPYDTFMWKGIDGTDVLTHFVTTKDPYQDPKSHFTTYNGQIHPGAIKGAWDRYQQKDINKDVLVSFGFGDGGGGATFEMLEVAKRLEKGIPGCPKVKMGTSKDYFKRLEKTVEGNRHLPEWVGELYLEFHRGTYTSMARNKRDNRKSENLYEAAEKFNSFAMLLGNKYPYETFKKEWKNILLNQFHDILPGSSIKDVYEVTKEEYKTILGKGNEMLESARDFIANRIALKYKSVVVFNTLSFERNDIAEFNVPSDVKNAALIDENGKEIVCQKLEGGKAIFFAENVPANGYKIYKIAEAKNAPVSDVVLSKDKAENEFFEIKFDEKGLITSFYDKKNERQVLKEGQLGNQLEAFEDKPVCFSNWNVDIFYDEKMWKVDDVQSIEVVDAGPVRSTLKITRKFEDSTIIQKVYVYKNLPRVDFDTYVDWKQSEVLLKAAFPIDINTDHATYEIQYGNVERPTHHNTSWDYARFEVCGHKWADVSEAGFGVSLLNNCKYGHDIKDGVMRLTLIKSGIEPNPTTDQEEHYFTYSLYPHAGDWRCGNTVQMAYDLNVPLCTKVEDAHDGMLPETLSMAKVDHDNVIIEVIKKAEESDELVVRLYECYNERTKVTLEMFREIEKAVECNLIERDLSEVVPCGNKLTFEMKPYEIKTFKISLK